MEEYNIPTTLSRKEEVLQNELNRIRSTASFKFGNHFVKALERPWKIFLLPFTIPMLMWKLFRSSQSLEVAAKKNTRNCVVLFSSKSNRGLHFDRCETLISRFIDPDLQIIHVTTDEFGIRGARKNTLYYLFPERMNVVGMNPKLWNIQCENFLNTILDIFSPKTFIFDGDYILVAEDGGYFDDARINIAYQVTDKFWVNNHAHIIQAKDLNENRFFMH